MSVRELVVTYLPWGLSAISIYGSWLAGNKDIRTWVISIGNQTLWMLWIVASGSWGFIPLNLSLALMSYRNYRKWKEDARRPILGVCPARRLLSAERP